jgi:hypothetical protein
MDNQNFPNLNTLETIAVKSMTRRQVKELRAAGLDPALFGGKKDPEKNAELVDWMIDNIYPELNGAEDMEYNKLVKLATDTYTYAYRGPVDEIKNS